MYVAEIHCTSHKLFNASEISRFALSLWLCSMQISTNHLLITCSLVTHSNAVRKCTSDVRPLMYVRWCTSAVVCIIRPIRMCMLINAPPLLRRIHRRKKHARSAPIYKHARSAPIYYYYYVITRLYLPQCSLIFSTVFCRFILCRIKNHWI